MNDPIRILLWFVRKDDSHDPFAFRFESQLYNVLDERGVVLRPVELPWSAALMRQLAALREPSPPQRALEALGAVLSEFLEPAGWAHHSKAIVEAKGTRQVVVTIRAAAAELFALPWELLTIKETQERLGALDHVILRYEWPGTKTVPARALPAGASTRRVLMAWAGEVPHEEHERAIRASAGAAKAGAAELCVVANASYTDIADALREATRAGRPFQLLHLLCHGGADEDGSYGLALASGDGGVETSVVAPARLQKLVSSNAGELRLVVVAACDSGSAGAPAARAGSVAQRMHQAGVQAVLASRYPLSITGSSRMTTALYRALLERDESVEQAVIAARVAIDDGAGFDWASLQLYARAADGVGIRVWPPAPKPVETVMSPGEGAATGATGGRAWIYGAVAVLVLGAGFGIVRALTPPPGADGAPAGQRASDAVVTAQKDLPAEASPGAATTEATTGDGTSSGSEGRAETDAKAPAEPGTTGAEPVAKSTMDPALAPETKKLPPARTDSAPKATPKPKTVRCSGAKEKCSKGLIDKIEEKLLAPTGGGSYSVKLNACVDGSVKLASCSGCSDALEREASGRAKRVSASVVKSKGKDKLPCYASFRWD